MNNLSWDIPDRLHIPLSKELESVVMWMKLWRLHNIIPSSSYNPQHDQDSVLNDDVETGILANHHSTSDYCALSCQLL